MVQLDFIFWRGQRKQCEGWIHLVLVITNGTVTQELTGLKDVFGRHYKTTDSSEVWPAVFSQQLSVLFCFWAASSNYIVSRCCSHIFQCMFSQENKIFGCQTELSRSCCVWKHHWRLQTLRASSARKGRNQSSKNWERILLQFSDGMLAANFFFVTKQLSVVLEVVDRRWELVVFSKLKLSNLELFVVFLNQCGTECSALCVYCSTQNCSLPFFIWKFSAVCEFGWTRVVNVNTPTCPGVLELSSTANTQPSFHSLSGKAHLQVKHCEKDWIAVPHCRNELNVMNWQVRLNYTNGRAVVPPYPCFFASLRLVVSLPRTWEDQHHVKATTPSWCASIA